MIQCHLNLEVNHDPRGCFLIGRYTAERAEMPSPRPTPPRCRRAAPKASSCFLPSSLRPLCWSACSAAGPAVLQLLRWRRILQWRLHPTGAADPVHPSAAICGGRLLLDAAAAYPGLNIALQIGAGRACFSAILWPILPMPLGDWSRRTSVPIRQGLRRSCQLKILLFV